jgi:hypothetical protein
MTARITATTNAAEPRISLPFQVRSAIFVEVHVPDLQQRQLKTKHTNAPENGPPKAKKTIYYSTLETHLTTGGDHHEPDKNGQQSADKKC